MTALAVEGLTVSAGATDLVRGVDLAVEPGRTLGLVGESGSGKSMTALAVMGLLPDAIHLRSGSVRVDGRDVVPLPESERRTVRGARVGMIYQEPMTALNPLMRVGPQIVEGLTAHGMAAQAARARAAETLERVGLPVDRALRAYPHQLSGGMRQRAMIAVAVAPHPRVLIADEPTTALDVTIQRQVIDLVDELRREDGMAVVWITHDLGVVAHIADRTAVMYAGRVVEEGATAELFARPSHPYTAGLLRSLPAHRGAERPPLVQIGGLPPDLAGLPPGCPFAPRCPQRREVCSASEPALLDRGPQRAACHIPPEEWSA
ncbi:ABC transporter ATP-binding protein [Actinomadura sp. DC4]|uniref:ABC transporter ATP-binding protein n=1 Tax=Actinomadura sp. DC4 TaxID=3055069 RepID=UPI0025B0E4B0|nr:ABC transporter ATP-binding protein [Actinomadura sp. DC4]MDN3351281.1 ABC transporter ATP-binding protein [Actinomadura sp. DC4]